MSKIAWVVAWFAVLEAVLGGFVTGILSSMFGWNMALLQFLIDAIFATLAFMSASVLMVDETSAETSAQRPNDSIAKWMLAAALLYVAVRYSGLVGIDIRHTGFGGVVRNLAGVAFAVAAVLALRFVQPRWVLLLGVGALALRFDAGSVLGLFSMKLPSWLPELITVFAAGCIAARLSLTEDTPADRVQGPEHLWRFGAAGLLAIAYGANPALVPWWFDGGLFGLPTFWSLAGLLLLLWTFLAFASHVDPIDTHQPGSGRAGAAAFIGVFIALFVLVGVTLGISEQIASLMRRFEYAPLIVCLAIAGAALFFVPAGRMPAEGPGRGMIFAGIVALLVASLGGWRIVSGFEGQAAWLALIFLAFFVAPLVVLGQTLLGIGLMRVLFDLQPPLGARRS